VQAKLTISMMLGVGGGSNLFSQPGARDLAGIGMQKQQVY